MENIENAVRNELASWDLLHGLPFPQQNSKESAVRCCLHRNQKVNSVLLGTDDPVPVVIHPSTMNTHFSSPVVTCANSSSEVDLQVYPPVLDRSDTEGVFPDSVLHNRAKPGRRRCGRTVVVRDLRDRYRGIGRYPPDCWSGQ